MKINFAYLAGGKLHLQLYGAPVRIIKSEFGQSVRERMRQIERRNFLRNKSTMANFMPPQMMRTAEQQDEADTPINIISICRGTAGKLFYALEVGQVSGIFSLDEERIKEQRLYHGSDFAVQYLDIHPEKNLIACAIMYQNGSANLGQMPLNGSRPRNITEGDSLDIAPKWIPGTEKALVYQSAGLGRNASGFVAERSPFRIEKLDFNSEEVVTLVEDPNFDLLGPQMTADGTLYYIKRPYRPLQQQFSVLDIIKQILLIPFRLLYAIFQWLNFFTMYYTGKPLQGAGNPISVDKKQQMKVWGEQIDLEKIANS